MKTLFILPWAHLMADAPKQKKLPVALMAAIPVNANEGKTSPARIKARRTDKETY